jgi:hypothetical protein
MTDKKTKGQFYTVKSDYILDGLPRPPTGDRVVEPFAGQGDLLKWIGRPVEAYDIDPKHPDVVMRDTLANPPDYTGAWVITNPPYLARNKSKEKEIFEKFSTNDLYKCFIHSLCMADPLGGILIIPAGFFLSPRDVDTRCRAAFMSKFKIIRVKYFEEQVFPDTPTTVVAIYFEKFEKKFKKQIVEWEHRPSGRRQNFEVGAEHGWIIGGDVYNLEGTGVKIRRFVKGQELRTGETLTNIWLCALDSGSADGRIRLEYREGDPYPAKDTSRSWATLTVEGAELSPEFQKTIVQKFNSLVEAKRAETWSLFLPQYRESKEYARKRIPFELAYSITEHLIHPK